MELLLFYCYLGLGEQVGKSETCNVSYWSESIEQEFFVFINVIGSEFFVFINVIGSLYYYNSFSKILFYS
jgi:hypothetical protein